LPDRVAARAREPRDANRAIERRFEAIVFDWDGTAVPDRVSDASRLRDSIERACREGIDVIIVSGTHVKNVDAQLAARPRGPGTLHMCLNRGSEIYRVTRGGVRLLQRRHATRSELASLDRASDRTIQQLAARGLPVRLVSKRLNRRKIDLLPDAAWADPPKARISDLVIAVQERLAQYGIGGLTAVIEVARDAARSSGMLDCRVTSDAKHVEIGLTDKSDSARWIMHRLWHRGIGLGQTLIVGDEFGPLGGVPGSDSFMLVSERPTAVSVGREPAGVPARVVYLGGGPETLLALIDDQVKRREACELPRPDGTPGWTVQGVVPTRPHNPAQEPLFTIADGRLGTNGSPLATSRRRQQSVLAAGLYDGEGPDCALLPCPVWHRLPAGKARHNHVRRTLDLHSGTLWYSSDRHSGTPGVVLFSSDARPGTAVLRADLGGDNDRTAAPLQAPSGRSVETGRDGEAFWMRAGSDSVGGVVAAAVDHPSEGGQVIDRIATYRVHPRRIPSPAAALTGHKHACDAGFERLLVEHRSAWATKWEDADIRIDGDDELQLAVRFSLFHLMASAARRGEAAVGARGLSGRGYGGHVFWDADVFVLPFLAATHPASARAMLEYRIRRLPAARAAAQQLERAGARFPWESARTGLDVTPSHVHDRETGQVIPIRTGALEDHIVADVAWAASCYVDWSGDLGFWDSGGSELLTETARYWASRIRVDRAGRAHIYGVIGPDEYHEPVDDNAFTNVMARWNLRKAALAIADQDAGARDRERQHWLELADALVDGYDPSTGIYEQFAGYMGLEQLFIADVAPRRPIAADLLLGAERVASSQLIKQADVLMLHHLVPDEVKPGSLDANLAFYEPRTAHGSSLSPGVHAAVMARAGNTEQALEALRLTSRIDLDNLTGTTATGLHLATMGSLWQALTVGFAGIRPKPDRLLIDPRTPDAWRRMEVRIRFRNSRVRIVIEHDRLRLEASQPVPIEVGHGPTVNVGPRGVTFARTDGTWSQAVQ
jgi:Glycosyl hydrolase family 65 central catalytic domain/Glycosyl hydrolase family 65, C-terminal domain